MSIAFKTPPAEVNLPEHPQPHKQHLTVNINDPEERLSSFRIRVHDNETQIIPDYFNQGSHDPAATEAREPEIEGRTWNGHRVDMAWLVTLAFVGVCSIIILLVTIIVVAALTVTGRLR
ncbi:hypothetical protein TEQG_05600 [Trichophyton equinum CBS 127.97]|uniref:Uncharacterized protein n=1 Tax=Trichophyton equinum (strain ATCC MYA-4606 / CBS 127.97) TaxID=559882 RepID=F2PXI4_TRIEC|nr:hypothetical protein TEQG_05600 [Trichophyton equinum CBS 127.97]